MSTESVAPAAAPYGAPLSHHEAGILAAFRDRLRGRVHPADVAGTRPSGMFAAF